MTTSPSAPKNMMRNHYSGMTLVELAIVLALGLFLVGMTFIGVRAWKNGADRASCVMNIYKMQQAVRNFAASRNYSPGQDLTGRVSADGLFGELVGDEKYVFENPVCPQDGIYANGGNVIPRVGELYLTCSLASERTHVPESYSTW